MKKILLSIIILSLLCGCSTEKVKDEVHTVTLSHKNRKQTLRYHLNGGKVVKDYHFNNSKKLGVYDSALTHPVLEKKGVIFLGWTTNDQSLDQRYHVWKKNNPQLFGRNIFDYYAVYGKFTVSQKGNKVRFIVDNIPYSNYSYYYYCLLFNKTRKTSYTSDKYITYDAYFETSVQKRYGPTDHGMKTARGSITRYAIDYTLELEKKGTYYYGVFVDTGFSATVVDDEVDYEQVNGDGPYLEGKITIK